MSFLSILRTAAVAAAMALAGSSLAIAQTTLNRMIDSDPETLDPAKTSTVTEAHVLRDLFEGLTMHDMRGRVIPGAAERWDISQDGRVYTFHIRQNARWSNGDPVRAQDFVFSIRRVADPATAAKYANILYAIRNVENVNQNRGARVEDIGARAIDDRTLEITLEQPVPYFLELLTHQTSLPVHPPSVQQHGANFVRPENLVSNGAYRIVEFVPGSHVRLRRNEHHWDNANTRIDVVNHMPVRDTAAGARRFAAGEIHLMVDIPADQLRTLRQQLGEQISVAPLLGTHYLSFNTSKAPFNDARVRRALSMVIDREFLADQIWNQTALPAYSLVPPGTQNYGEPPVPDWHQLSTIDREERARALLREAGFTQQNPLRVQIRFNMTDNNRATMVAIADMWKQIGVETTTISTDGRTHFAYLRDRGDYDVARAGWVADFNDPQNFLFLLESGNTGLNYARWESARYDQLMRDAAAELDLNRRAAILRQAESLMLEEVPYAPILYFTNRNMIAPRVVGFSPNARGAFASRFLSLRQ